MPSSSSLPNLAETALFFDFDGTLCALAPTPDAVALAPEVPALLTLLRKRTANAVAIVTGRPIADIDHFLAPLTLPIAGSHGAERRGLDGAIEQIGFGDPRLLQLQQDMKVFVADHAGLLLESKGAGLALHFRAAPQWAGLVEQTLTDAIAPHGGAFVLQPGKMVFEVKPKGVDKGIAIRRFMEDAPFSGRVPLFAGDDLTDEKGFAVVNAIGGLSVKIGDGETIAGLRLESVDAFIAWLTRVAAA